MGLDRDPLVRAVVKSEPAIFDSGIAHLWLIRWFIISRLRHVQIASRLTDIEKSIVPSW
jgi:hypothetical protein